jgi:hypothetical protein
MTNLVVSADKLSLFLRGHHSMKIYEEMEVKLHAFLTSEFDGSELSSVLTPRK